MPATGMAERPASSCSDCSECSQCAKRSHNRTKEGVRVSMNLGHFFTDQRARAFMWAPYGRCVQWLGRRVARIYGLPNDIALMSRGHMLPVNEPLLMLDRDDPIEVVTIAHVFTAYENEDGRSAGSQKHSNETLPQPSRESTSGRPNVNIKQENPNSNNNNQVPTSSQVESCAQNQNVAGDNLAPESNAAAGRSIDGMDERERLQWLKRRALRMLDEQQMLSDMSMPTRARRRRRRRKQQADEGHNQNEAIDLRSDEEPSSNCMEAEAANAGVVRNSSGTRPPRLIRALSPVAQVPADAS